ncbi:MAG: glycosyltransferase [Bacteroidia bacterium]|nr:glycosyltransferase [Bacteroidia bacterium]
MTENKFSILIPSWNNLPYLKICIDSIRKNSRYTHQIIVHVNEGADETATWLKENEIEFTCSDKNIGICSALNSAFELSRTDYIMFMNDDMYCCPEWDLFLWNEIQAIGHENFFLSSTMIEPNTSGNPCVLAPYDFGRNAETFHEKELLDSLPKLNFHDWYGSTWPPNVVHRALWKAVGGLSEEFSPGMYSDPDFSMKLWQQGVRHFKGIGKSLVYHFQSKSTGKVKKNNGRKQFLKKWGVSASYFSKEILRSGQPFKGELPDRIIRPTLKDKVKKLFS